MSKVGAALFAMEQKHHIEDVSIECLAMLGRNKVKFCVDSWL